MNEISKVTGHANPGGMQQFQQIATALTTVNFYGVKAVGADAVIASITNVDGTSALGYFGSAGKAFQGEFYPGKWKDIQLTSGEVILYLNEQ